MTIGEMSAAGQLALSLWDRAKKLFAPKSEGINLNYIRLFGLHGIGRIWLRNGERQGRKIDSFLKSWEFAAAGIIMSEPLEWLRGVSVPQIILETHPKKILGQFAPNSTVNWTDSNGGGFLVGSPKQMTPEIEAHFHYPECWIIDDCACFACCSTLQSAVMSQDQNIGSLAVAIENRSNSDLKNLVLNYLLVQQSSPGEVQKCVLPQLKLDTLPLKLIDT